MPTSAKYWDKTARKYAASPIKDEAAYQRKLEVTREYFRPDMEVLELGCGTGSTAIAHAPYVKHIRAVDISKNMLEIAHERAEAADVKNVSFECATVEGLAAADESVDAVLALSLLHLLEDKEAAVARVHAMLKPGGVFVTSTACVGDMMKFIKYVAPLGRLLGLMPLVKVFTSRELERTVSDAGFEIAHTWQPGKMASFFMVATKATS